MESLCFCSQSTCTAGRQAREGGVRMGGARVAPGTGGGQGQVCLPCFQLFFRPKFFACPLTLWRGLGAVKGLDFPSWLPG